MAEKNYIATLQEILKGRNEEFDKSKAIALVRHADNRKDKQIDGVTFKESLYDLYRFDRKKFMTYQSRQLASRFEKIEYVVCCLGESGTLTRFIAVYRILGWKPSPVYDNEIILDLEELPEFKVLSERVLFDWGKATVSWCQNFNRETNIKHITRIDSGLMDEDGVIPFKSFPDTILSFSDLKNIFFKSDKNWKKPLESVNCVYLIQDRKTGKQYVGVTYGREGIWGRWKVYVDTNGHGNNIRLKELLDKDPKYAENYFQWCILETLAINTTQEEAIDRESLYKRKFMTREYGYNEN